MYAVGLTFLNFAIDDYKEIIDHHKGVLKNPEKLSLLTAQSYDIFTPIIIVSPRSLQSFSYTDLRF